MFDDLINSDPDYKNLLNDAVKYTTLIVVINLLFFIAKSNTTFFNSLFLDVWCFIIIALCGYWLVIKKLVKFD